MPSFYHERNSSFSLRTEQAFLIAMDAIETIIPLTFLAFCGHCLTQRIQEMQVWESAVKRSGSIACTGHFSAHSPHLSQRLVTFGTSPALPLFL